MEGYDAYSLTILTDSTEISIAYADMAWLQRSLGIHSRLIAGTIIGLGAGIFVGFRGASNVECNNESCVGEAIAATAILLLGSGGGTLCRYGVAAKKPGDPLAFDSRYHNRLKQHYPGFYEPFPTGIRRWKEKHC